MLQSRGGIPTATMKNTRPIESHPNEFPLLSSPFATAKASITPIAVTVTPSPKLKDNRGNDEGNASKELDSASIPFAEEGNEKWRQHGKLFRANIVSADEGNGGNIFSLSDSCAIERYYRVADRVLEQFLSSNIAERNDLIESYLVGNRLFKFLSVVLPTHHQYFSSEPRLEELRNGSELQIMELLEYMEELELMIDEMEYNRYILKDLTPTEPQENTGRENIMTNEIPQEDWIVRRKFLHEFTKRSGADYSEKSDTILTARPKMSSEKKQQTQPQQRGAQHSNKSDDSYGRFQSGNVKVAVQAIESSNQLQKLFKPDANDSQNHDQILKQRVAAVVTANSNVELSTNSRRSMRSISNRSTRTSSLPSPNVGGESSDSNAENSHTDFKNSSLNDANSIVDKGSFQDRTFPPYRAEVKTNSAGQQLHTDRQQLKGSEEEPQLSWDADFSQFNVFSSEKSQVEDIAELEPGDSNTGLTIQNSYPRSKKQSERRKPLPKIKEPPFSYPRSVWGHAHVHAARLSSSFEGQTYDSNERQWELPSAQSDCSSDIFHSLEDPVVNTEPVKTKIEERLEHAMDPRNNPPRDNDFTVTQRGKSSALEANTQRKLINQFRGCVRFLLD